MPLANFSKLSKKLNLNPGPLFHGLITVIFCSNSYIHSFVPFLINCDPLQTGNDSFTVPANPALIFYFFPWDSKFLMVNTALYSILH